MTNVRLALANLLFLTTAAVAGCMGEPTREILLPAKLKGAKVTTDGEEAIAVRQEIVSVVPLRAGVQVVRVEPARGVPLVQRTRIFVNDPKAERVGENVIVAKVEQSTLRRTVVSFPEDPLNHLGHDFEPPASGEGVVLLSSQRGARATVDGRVVALSEKPGIYNDAYVTGGVVVKLPPGKHRVEFAKAGFRSCAVDVEVKKGEYEVIGATLGKAQEAGK
jgi:hypothetical protein